MNARKDYLRACIGFDYVISSENYGGYSEFVVSDSGEVIRYKVYGDCRENFEIYKGGRV